MHVCGICPDVSGFHAIPATAQEEQDKDIQSLYLLAADDNKAIRNNETDESSGEKHKLCIYTDGSCLRPRSKTLAHAGWGISFGGTADAATDYGALQAIVQTSYRAELRAVAQALARCKCTAIISQRATPKFNGYQVTSMIPRRKSLKTNIKQGSPRKHT